MIEGFSGRERMGKLADKNNKGERQGGEAPELSDAEREILERVAKICESRNLHGLDFQHAALCETRAWLHLRRISTAMLDERARLGAALHREREGRDASVSGLLGISPDSADWDRLVVEERKGKFSRDAGSSAQTEFYGWMLSFASGRKWTAVERGISDKKSEELPLDPESLSRLLILAKRLDELAEMGAPPPQSKKGICEKCSFRWLCWGDAE